MTNSYGYEGFIDGALGAALAAATTDEIPLLPRADSGVVALPRPTQIGQ